MSFTPFVDNNFLTASQLNTSFGNTIDITTAVAQSVASAVTFSGAVTYGGAEFHKVFEVTAAGTYSVTTSDYVVAINKTVAATSSVVLPTAPANGRTLIIKDRKGDAGLFPIAISGAQNIDSTSTISLNINSGSVTLCFNSTSSQWMIL